MMMVYTVESTPAFVLLLQTLMCCLDIFHVENIFSICNHNLSSHVTGVLNVFHFGAFHFFLVFCFCYLVNKTEVNHSCLELCAMVLGK